MGLEGRAEQGAISIKQRAVLVALLLEQAGGALDVGEQKGGGVARSLRHSCLTAGVVTRAGALYCGASSQQRAAGWHLGPQPRSGDGLRRFLNLGNPTCQGNDNRSFYLFSRVFDLIYILWLPVCCGHCIHPWSAHS